MSKWSVVGSVGFLPIKTTATFVGPGLGVPVTSTGDVKLNTTELRRSRSLSLLIPFMDEKLFKDI
jgi:hypothetical protein